MIGMLCIRTPVPQQIPTQASSVPRQMLLVSQQGTFQQALRHQTLRHTQSSPAQQIPPRSSSVPRQMHSQQGPLQQALSHQTLCHKDSSPSQQSHTVPSYSTLFPLLNFATSGGKSFIYAQSRAQETVDDRKALYSNSSTTANTNTSA